MSNLQMIEALCTLCEETEPHHSGDGPPAGGAGGRRPEG